MSGVPGNLPSPARRRRFAGGVTKGRKVPGAPSWPPRRRSLSLRADCPGGVLTSEAWPDVQRQFFNPEHFRASWPDVLDGFWLNVQMFLIAEVLILVVSLGLAMVRALRGPAFFPLRALVIGYIDLIRGVPIILLILLLGFGVPALQLPGVPISPLFWGVAALVISYSAYTAEVYRAGIDSVHESQTYGGPVPGAHPSSITAICDSAPGDQKCDPGPSQRFCFTPEGRRPCICARSQRSGEGSRDLQRQDVQLHPPSWQLAVLFLLVSVPVARLADWYTERDRRRRQSVGAS